jgi:putative endonuclease
VENKRFDNNEDEVPAFAGMWYVYIMTNRKDGVLYIGVTDNIERRVWEHKNKFYKKSFTARYNCDKLVYFEEFDNGMDAVIREKQFKKWNRQWKVNFIEEMNPSWMDISMNWNYDGSKNKRQIWN